MLAIVAALNEEQGVGPTIAELRQHLNDIYILVVDGKSHDGTAEVSKNMNAEVIVQEGTGKGDAVAQAIKQVTANADFVVFTDADYTYPAEHIPRMIRVLEENPNVGMVCGNRFDLHFHLNEMNSMFYFGNRVLAFAHNMLNGVALSDPLTGLRVVRGEILRGWTPKSKGFDIEVELNHHVERQGFKIVEIPIHYRDRLGEKKLKMRDGLPIFKRILLEGFHAPS